jgi:hypothetical protein
MCSSTGSTMFRFLKFSRSYILLHKEDRVIVKEATFHHVWHHSCSLACITHYLMGLLFDMALQPCQSLLILISS